MVMLGQSSSGWNEGSAALALLNVGIRNTVGVLTADSFTQTNPPIVSTPDTTISTQTLTLVPGVLSGSVAFVRGDEGSNYVGGPIEPGTVDSVYIRPLGCFINNAVGNAYENQPGPASGKGPYMSGQGTYANALFETQALATVGAIAQGDTLQYTPGQELVASRNGYLQMRTTTQSGAEVDLDVAGVTSEVANGRAASTLIAILKMVPDSESYNLVYDQRI